MSKITQMALWEAVASSSYNRYAGPAAKLLTDTCVRADVHTYIR